MFSNITIENRSYAVRSVEEHINFELHGFLNLDLIKIKNANIANWEFKFRRNLVDDTYSAWVKHDRNRTDASIRYFLTQVNVNNRSIVNSSKSGDYPRMEETDFAHHSVLGSTQLRETSLISVDWIFSDYDELRNSQLLGNLTMSVHQLPLVNLLDLKPNEVGVFKALKELNVKFIPSTLPSSGKFVTTQNNFQHFKVTKSFNYFIVKPRPVDQFGHARDAFDLYTFNESNASTNYDFIVSNVTYKSNAIANDITAVHSHSKTSSVHIDVKTESDRFFKQADALGSVQVTESMFYDYAKRQVVKGVSKDSQVGELIPFNFKGSYVRQIEMALNHVFKKVKIRYQEEIEQPVLEPFTGKVKLKLSVAKKMNFLQFKLSLLSIQKIRDKIKAKNALPLTGLKQLSDAIQP